MLSSELININSFARDVEKNPKEARKIVKIMCILLTNCDKYGVSIKISRFNHSCQPNAAVLWAGTSREVRAISDIQSGQEITITYG